MSRFVYGKHPVLELAKSGTRVEQVFVTDPHNDIAAAFKKSGVPVVVLPQDEFKRRFAQYPHQGIVAQTAPFAYRDVAWLRNLPVKKHGLIVLLDGIEDPQNLGAIARSAFAAGADALLVRQDRQVLVTPAAVKASAGYLLRLDVVLFTNAVQVTEMLKKAGYWVVGAVAGATQNYRTVDPDVPLVVIIGNEHKGISRLLVEKLDFPVSISMADGIDSLNASAAASVILLDLYNRRKGQ